MSSDQKRYFLVKNHYDILWHSLQYPLYITTLSTDPI